MPSATWALGWLTGDVVTAAEFRKGVGCVADSTLGVSAASINLTGIPTTYAHLLIAVSARTDRAATGDTFRMRFNGDSAANYYDQLVSGSSAAVTTTNVAGATGFASMNCPGATAPANTLSGTLIFIPDYGSASRRKTFVALDFTHAADSATNQFMQMYGGAWIATPAALNQLTFSPVVGTNLAAGSRVSVYVMGS